MIRNIILDKDNKELVIIFDRYRYIDCNSLVEKRIKLFINENITDMTIDSIDNSWNCNRCSADLTLFTDKEIYYRKWFIGKKSTKYLIHDIRIEIKEACLNNFDVIIFLDDNCIYKKLLY